MSGVNTIASLSVSSAMANAFLLITGNALLGIAILLTSLTLLIYLSKMTNASMINTSDSVAYLSMANLLFSMVSILWWLR